MDFHFGRTNPKFVFLANDMGEGASVRLENKATLASELAGVEFIDENGGGPGVRLRNRQRPKQTK
jgi:hypothetical protein